jgi:hypothetical protein
MRSSAPRDLDAAVYNALRKTALAVTACPWSASLDVLTSAIIRAPSALSVEAL